MAIVWGCELVLARTSSDPQVVPDVIASALCLGLLGFVPVVALARTALPARWKGMLMALASIGPAELVVLGIVGPPAWHRGRAWLVVLFALLAVLAERRARRGWRGDEPIPGPAFLLALLAGAAFAGWMLQTADFPPASIWLSALLLASLTALLASRRATLALAAVVPVVVALWPLSSLEATWRATGPVPQGPDIVVLTADTLRADAAVEMESYQRLAARGVTFAHAQAAAPWTLPSMATIFTGRQPGQHGAGRWTGVDGYGAIHASRSTLAMRLDAHGYDTAAIVAPNGMVGRRFGFDRGFATYDYTMEFGRYALPKGIDRSGIARPTIARLLMIFRLIGRRPTGDAETLVSRAIDVLEKRRDRPLLLWIHFLDSHLPYRHAEQTPLPWFRKMSLSAGPGKPEIVADPFWSTEEGREMLWTGYRHEIDFMDGAISRLLDWLDEHPGRERVILFTADHGEEIFDHHDFEHGHELYQELVATPLVIAGPPGRWPPGRVEDRVVGHLDIVPTLLAAAGIPDDSLPGQDLGAGIAEAPHLSDNMLLDGPAEARFAVRAGRWKAIFGPGQEAELYDLEDDPAEERDVAESHPELVARLARHRPQIDRSLIGAASLNEELKDALRALGYAAD